MIMTKTSINIIGLLAALARAWRRESPSIASLPNTFADWGMQSPDKAAVANKF
jgi:hypothetical protein